MSILEPFGLTPEHNLAIANMDKNFSGNQFDYAAASTKDMVDRASNPLTSVMSAVGNVGARPVYDFVDAAKEYGKKGYQGEFSLTPQGVIDFGKNLGAFGKEFLDQKPGTMMGGAFKGGIESLGTQLGESIYDKFNPSYEEDDEYDFSNIKGQTAMLGLPQLIGMLQGGFSKKAAINYAKRRAALSAANLALSTGTAIAGQKNKPSAAQIQSRLDSGIQNARERRSDRNVGGGRGVQSLGTSATARGSKSAQGYSQHAHGGRAGYFDGGLLSLWPR